MEEEKLKVLMSRDVPREKIFADDVFDRADRLVEEILGDNANEEVKSGLLYFEKVLLNTICEETTTAKKNKCRDCKHLCITKETCDSRGKRRGKGTCSHHRDVWNQGREIKVDFSKQACKNFVPKD